MKLFLTPIAFVFAFVASLWAIPSSAVVSCESVYLSRSHVSAELAKAIQSLTENQPIPDSIYQRFPVNEIAKALVQKILADERKWSGIQDSNDHKPVNLLQETDLILFFSERDAASIFKRGFLNQHETGKSNGLLDPQLRKDAEDKVTGLQMGSSEQALQLRPKSAFLNIRTDTPLAAKDSTMTHRYGNIGAVLKPELKNRTLWVSTDSLELGRGRYTRDFSPQSLSQFRGTFFRETLPCRSVCDSYYEALVYGTIAPTDVDYFLVTDESLAGAFVQFGRPIYKAQAVRENNRIVFKKGPLVDARQSEFVAERFSKILESVGIPEKVSKYKLNLNDSESYKLDRIATDHLKEYYVYSAGRDKARFAGAVSKIAQTLDRLSSYGVLTAPIELQNEQVALQRIDGAARELSEIPPQGRSYVLYQFAHLIQELVEKKLFVKDLAPSALIEDEQRKLVIRSGNGVLETNSCLDSIHLFESQVVPQWQPFLGEELTQKLKDFLVRLKNRHPASEDLILRTH